jgi:xanthine permease XanP
MPSINADMTTSKPTNIIYGVDDKPPLGTCLLLACQQLIPPASLTMFAVVVGQHIGLGPLLVEHMVTMSLLAAAVGVALQALRRGPVGSGYLASQTPSAIYIHASIAAGLAGGPSLIWGMTLVSGLFESALSRLVRRLKRVFPPQVSGIVVAMVGLSLVGVAVRKSLGLDAQDHISELEEVIVASLTLGCLVALSVWARGWLRLYSILISIALGYAVALPMGVVDEQAFLEIGRVDWLDLPSLHMPGWSFDWALLPPFIVAAFAATAKTVGLVVTSQKINYPDEKEADMERAGNGVLADGLGNTLAGLLGTIGLNTSPTSVSLTEATGATSRIVAFYTAGLLVISCFFPKIIAVIAMMPKPIMGAILVYSVCVISFNGLQLIMSCKHTPKLTFLVGLSMLAGLSVEMVPGLFDQLPDWGQHTFKSPVTVSAVTAILLNLVFQAGEKRQKKKKK